MLLASHRSYDTSLEHLNYRSFKFPLAATKMISADMIAEIAAYCEKISQEATLATYYFDAGTCALQMGGCDHADLTLPAKDA